MELNASSTRQGNWRGGLKLPASDLWRPLSVNNRAGTPKKLGEFAEVLENSQNFMD
jgi:hypothetical protein